MVAEGLIPFAKRDSPRDRALVQVDSREHGIRRRGERQTAGQVDGLSAAREDVRVGDRDERIGSLVLREPVQADAARGAHEQIAALRIEGRAAPVSATALAWPLQRAFERWR